MSDLVKENKFPPEMKDYEALFNRMMFESVCNNYYQPVKNGDCSTNQLLKAGLETMIIYVFENSRKYIESVSNVTMEKHRVESSKKILNSEQFEILGKNSS